MDDNIAMLDIILFAMVAAFLALRLWSVLGRRPGNEPPRHAAPLHGSHPDEDVEEQDAAEEDQDANDGMADIHAMPDHVRIGLDDIYHADRSFRIEDFLDGARTAYRMILEGFWSGRKDVFRPYVSDDVYEQFAGAIDARAEAGLTLENSLLEILEANMDSATLQDGKAEIVMRFEGDTVAVTRDKDDKVIEGDVTDSVRMTDIWTFERDVRSSDPNWLLAVTRAE